MSQNDTYRHAERCMYDYKRNIARLEVLKGDLEILRTSCSVKGQNYDVLPENNGTHGDPVSALLEKCEHIEHETKKLMRWTKPITSLISDLDSPDSLNESHNQDLLKVLKLFYFDRNPMEQILVVGGHQRLKVLKELGNEEIECVIVNIDEVHEKALNLALNKVSGEWDKDCFPTC